MRLKSELARRIEVPARRMTELGECGPVLVVPPPRRSASSISASPRVNGRCIGDEPSCSGIEDGGVEGARGPVLEDAALPALMLDAARLCWYPGRLTLRCSGPSCDEEAERAAPATYVGRLASPILASRTRSGATCGSSSESEAKVSSRPAPAGSRGAADEEKERRCGGRAGTTTAP
jgi:hypothetical protein